MKFYSKLFYYLNVSFLMLPSRAFASEENTASSVKTTSSLATDTLNADPMSGSYLMQLVIGLFIVVLCILVLAWFAKKMNRFHSLADGSLKVIGGLSMGSRERVVLLQVGEEQLLLGISPGRINTLHVLDTPLEVVGPHGDSEPGNSFLDKLKITMADANNASLKKQSK
jgi:flagellar protein FliO/FliZ